MLWGHLNLASHLPIQVAELLFDELGLPSPGSDNFPSSVNPKDMDEGHGRAEELGEPGFAGKPSKSGKMWRVKGRSTCAAVLARLEGLHELPSVIGQVRSFSPPVSLSRD